MSGVEWPDLVPSLRAQLPAHHDLPVERITKLKISESATFLVGANGTVLERAAVVRVYRAGRHSPSMIRSELEWIEAARADGVPTAAVVRCASGELGFPLECADGVARYCVVFEYIEADAHAPGLTATFAAIGAACGRLQQHARMWRSRAKIDRPNWDLAATMSPDTSWGNWRALPMSTMQREVLEKAHASVLGALPPFDDAHTILLHADLKPVNSIWSEGRLIVIDFDDCGFGYPLFDLAASLTFYEDHPELPELVDAWLTGFAEHASISSNDLMVLPTLIMQRRLMVLGWIASHPDSRGDLDLDAAVRSSVEVARRYLADALLPGAHGVRVSHLVVASHGAA